MATEVGDSFQETGQRGQRLQDSFSGWTISGRVGGSTNWADACTREEGRGADLPRQHHGVDCAAALRHRHEPLLRRQGRRVCGWLQPPARPAPAAPPPQHNPPPQRRTPPGTLHWRGAVSKVPGLPGTGKGGRHVGGGLGSKSMSRMRSGAARRVWGIVLNWAHRPPNRHRWPAPTPPKKPGNANCVEGWPADPNSWNMGGGRWSKPILLGEDDGGCVESRPLHACFAIP